MMNGQHYSRIASIAIVSLQIQETGTYNQQFARPYMTDMDAYTINQVTDRVSDALGRGESITASTLQGLGTSIIVPSAAHQGLVNIANGWNEQRLRFILTVECTFKVGSKARFYYTGYTSHFGVGNRAQSLDPNMVFVINSVVRTHVAHSMDPITGPTSFENSTGSKHLMCNNDWSGATAPQQMYLMRPEDILSYMQTSHLGANGGDLIDTRRQGQSNAQASNMMNGLGNIYAANVLNASMKAQYSGHTSQAEYDILAEARKMTNERMENPLLSAISNVRSSSIVNNTFSLSELLAVDPSTPTRTVYVPLTEGDMRNIHTAGQTMSWDGSDRRTHAAVMLNQGIPALMSDLMLRNIAFVSSNHQFGSQISTRVMGGSGLSDLNLPQRFEMFKTRFEQTLLHDITFGNESSFYMEVRADTLGETWIKISLDSPEVLDYVFPSFSSNILSPVVTNSRQVADKVASDMESLIDNVRQMATTNIPTTMFDTSMV